MKSIEIKPEFPRRRRLPECPLTPAREGGPSTYQTSRSFPISYSASDTPGASGLASVSLYYSTSAAGPWTSAGSFTSSPISFTAPADGTYYFYTIAVDRAGNTEPAPSTPDASTKVDTAAPTLSISSPTSGQVLGSSTVGISWVASDAVSGIERYEIQLDGGSWTSTGTALSYTFNGVTDGSHSAGVRAVDRAGNQAERSVSFVVDTAAPLLGITSPLPGAIVGSNSLDVSWSATDATSGIDRFEIRLDGGTWTRIGTATSHTFSALADGSHSVSVRAVDAAGNEAIASATFTVDATAPSLSIESPSQGTTVTSGSLEVRWSGSDATSGIDHYEVQVDGGSWITTGPATTYTFAGLADGQHTVTIRAVDRAGNAQTATLTFSVNTNPFSPQGPAGGFALYSLIADARGCQ